MMQRISRVAATIGKTFDLCLVRKGTFLLVVQVEQTAPEFRGTHGQGKISVATAMQRHQLRNL
jgi:hypothetical protein